MGKMESFKKIDIFFENCNEVSIEAKDIRYFSIDEVTRRLCSFNGSGQFSELQNCKKVLLLIANNALSNKTYFEQETNNEINSFLFHLKNYHDITHINIVFEDGSSECVGVPWGEGSDVTNSLEKVDFDEGIFTIAIVQ